MTLAFIYLRNCQVKKGVNYDFFFPRKNWHKWMRDIREFCSLEAEFLILSNVQLLQNEVWFS